MNDQPNQQTNDPFDQQTNEQNNPAQEHPQPTKKPLYKRWWVWIAAAAAIVLAIVLFNGGDPVQDDLLDYVNNDMTEIVKLDEEVSELYETARSSGSDYTIYGILLDQVIPKSRELIEKAEAVEVETDELEKLHELYLDALNKQDQAFTLLLSAIEEQDFATVTQANEKLDDARKLMREYISKLEKLAEEHNVEFE